MASFDEKQQDLTVEDDGWQVQDKKKINKKKTPAPTGTTPVKFERKPFDTRGDVKGSYRPSGESSGMSSWRKGAAGTGTTQLTPTKLKDVTKPNEIFYVKPSIDETLSIIGEKLDSVKRVLIPESTQIETPFAQHPYASLLISALYGLKVTDAFSLSYEKAEGDIINTLVRCSLEFPEEIGAPQLQHFTAPQLQELVKLITTTNHISNMHGLLTWAEGSFRQDSHAEFHAHLRVPANALLSRDPAQRDFLSEALLHSYDYASCDIKCDMQPYETTNEEEKRARLQSMVLQLIRRPDQPVTSDHELYWLTRPFDNLQVTIWDNMKRNPTKAVCNCLWNPLSPTPTSAWYKLPVANAPAAFHLFGFDDREFDLHSHVTSLADKAALPQAKFLRYDAKRHCLQLTRNPLHASVFRHHTETHELQLVWKDNVTLTESSRALYTFLVAKKHQSTNAINVYFDDDFDKLRCSLGHLTGAPWQSTQHSLEQFRSYLAFHPFLPIIGVRKPTNGGEEESVAVVAALQRVVALLQHCQQPPVQVEGEVSTNAFGCEVVLLLNALREGAEEAWKESVVGIPGYSLFTPLEREEWTEVIGFCWLLPVHFYHNVLLPDTVWKETWFKRCEELGKQFKVIS